VDASGNPHLTLDLTGCPVEKLADIGLIFNLLEELPLKLGLVPLATPSVFRYNGKAEEEGVTGVVLVEDAHISVHTFPDRGRALIEIFSCRDFAADQARELLLAALEAKDHELTIINRNPELTAPLEERVRPRVYH
jgi:S-adenosylmethionine/arginine decarboxylase-like enzyme